MPRRGALLILVAGMVSMLAVLAVAFLARMRSDARAADLPVRIAQCRLMLHASLSYLQEASRLGYAVLDADGRCLQPREGWGWIDVRDPSELPAGAVAAADLRTQDGVAYAIGPRGRDGRRLWSDDSAWPAPGTRLIAPMHRWKRAPWAVKPTIAPNRIPNDEAETATFGVPFLIAPDPEPDLEPGANRRSWAEGDPTPVATSTNLSWFRIYRENGSEPERSAGSWARGGPVGATFIVTVGDGGTMGYADFAEARALGASPVFGGDDTEAERVFAEQRAAELREWYRVEWSPAVAGGEESRFLYAQMRGRSLGPEDGDSWWSALPVNGSRVLQDGEVLVVAPAAPRNYVGTIRYIQRLDTPPARW